MHKKPAFNQVTVQFSGQEEQEILHGLHLEAMRAGVSLQQYCLHVLSYAVTPETRAYMASARPAEADNGQESE